MGYKLAGYDVIGCNEIDPKIARHYVRNLKPKYHFIEPIQTFKLRDDLPEELYNLDVLDGRPPAPHSQWQGIGRGTGGVRSTLGKDSKRKSLILYSLTSSTLRRNSDQRWL